MVYIAYLQAGGKENAGSYNKLLKLPTPVGVLNLEKSIL